MRPWWEQNRGKNWPGEGPLIGVRAVLELLRTAWMAGSGVETLNRTDLTKNE
jgi:hypothetical protein